MNFTVKESKIREIKAGDPLFTIQDGITYSHRASIKISNRCPENYKDLVLECMRHGWIKPVAYMHEREVILNGLVR